MNKPIDEKTLAYIAGFFDADGSVGVYLRKSEKGSRGGHYVLVVSITQKRTAVLYWLQEYFGGSVCKRESEDARANPLWSISNQKALKFLLQICPYVRYKKDQVELAIGFQQRKRHTGSGRSLSDAEFGYQQFVSDELKRRKRE